MSTKKQSPYEPFLERVLLPSFRIGTLLLAVLAIGFASWFETNDTIQDCGFKGGMSLHQVFLYRNITSNLTTPDSVSFGLWKHCYIYALNCSCTPASLRYQPDVSTILQVATEHNAVPPITNSESMNRLVLLILSTIFCATAFLIGLWANRHGKYIYRRVIVVLILTTFILISGAFGSSYNQYFNQIVSTCKSPNNNVYCARHAVGIEVVIFAMALAFLFIALLFWFLASSFFSDKKNFDKVYNEEEYLDERFNGSSFFSWGYYITSKLKRMKPANDSDVTLTTRTSLTPATNKRRVMSNNYFNTSNGSFPIALPEPPKSLQQVRQQKQKQQEEDEMAAWKDTTLFDESNNKKNDGDYWQQQQNREDDNHYYNKKKQRRGSNKDYYNNNSPTYMVSTPPKAHSPRAQKPQLSTVNNYNNINLSQQQKKQQRKLSTDCYRLSPTSPQHKRRSSSSNNSSTNSSNEKRNTSMDFSNSNYLKSPTAQHKSSKYNRSSRSNSRFIDPTVAVASMSPSPGGNAYYRMSPTTMSPHPFQYPTHHGAFMSPMMASPSPVMAGNGFQNSFYNIPSYYEQDNGSSLSGSGDSNNSNGGGPYYQQQQQKRRSSQQMYNSQVPILNMPPPSNTTAAKTVEHPLNKKIIKDIRIQTYLNNNSAVNKS